VPVGIYKRTEEHRKNMSLAKKGKSWEEILGSKEKADERKKQQREALKGIRKGKTDVEIMGIEKARLKAEITSEFRKGKKLEEIVGFEEAKRLKKEQSERNKGKTYEEIMGSKEKADERKRKQSIAMKGYQVTEETCEKLSKYFKGKSWEEIMKSEEKAKERKKHQSEVLTGYKQTEETKKNMREAQNKPEVKNKISKAAKIANKRPEVIKRRSEAQKICQGRLEIRKRKRLNRIKQLEKNLGGGWANYNPKACEIFKLFDEKNFTKGRYAVYGGGEYKILELGYSLDYIEHEYKIIIEVYEKYHFNIDGTLRQKDVIREQEIKAHFPDYKFYAFKVEDMNKILEIIINEKIEVV